MKALCRQLAENTGLSRERVDISFEAIWPNLKGDVTNDLRSLTTPGPPPGPGPRPEHDPDRPFEVAALEIMGCLNYNKLDMVSFDRIREKIDETYSNEFLMSVIKKFSEKFRRATLRDNVPGVGRAEF
ncbi:MAG TPA: hypothetical protein VN256_07005 [Pyrinomonadaceae bacterium]|nr:hypothetical protein [Pyrinomonadaceae bacterium]